MRTPPLRLAVLAALPLAFGCHQPRERHVRHSVDPIIVSIAPIYIRQDILLRIEHAPGPAPSHAEMVTAADRP